MPTGSNIVKLLLLLSFPFSNGMRLCGVNTLCAFAKKLILTTFIHSFINLIFYAHKNLLHSNYMIYILK